MIRIGWERAEAKLGGQVPVIVNRRRTRAAFDLDDPSVGTRAIQKRADERRKARQAKRRAGFEEKLRGGS